ncbi:MAG TPA: CAP domain-containing protein, partial [Candidatus Binataceae bacterium]|nr:CAP domain-containing protein [Candidatus Binataceae bacterium]
MAGTSCAIATSDTGCDGTAPLATCGVSASTNQPGVEEQILALVNAQRENAGCQPLSSSCELANAAHDHNLRMASGGFFDHRGEGEAGLFDRLIAAGSAVESAGENLFMMSNSPPDSLAHQCVVSWMNSDGHRRNLLSPNFDSTGISVVYSKGESYVTEDFARVGTPMRVTRKTARRRHAAARHSAPRHSSRLIASRRGMHYA